MSGPLQSLGNPMSQYNTSMQIVRDQRKERDEEERRKLANKELWCSEEESDGERSPTYVALRNSFFPKTPQKFETSTNSSYRASTSSSEGAWNSLFRTPEKPKTSTNKSVQRELFCTPEKARTSTSKNVQRRLFCTPEKARTSTNPSSNLQEKVNKDTDANTNKSGNYCSIQ